MMPRRNTAEWRRWRDRIAAMEPFDAIQAVENAVVFAGPGAISGGAYLVIYDCLTEINRWHDVLADDITVLGDRLESIGHPAADQVREASTALAQRDAKLELTRRPTRSK